MKTFTVSPIDPRILTQPWYTIIRQRKAKDATVFDADPALVLRTEPRVSPGFRLSASIRAKGPSERFISLTRNPKLAAEPPRRFEPTSKQPGDVIL